MILQVYPYVVSGLHSPHYHHWWQAPHDHHSGRPWNKIWRKKHNEEGMTGPLKSIRSLEASTLQQISLQELPWFNTLKWDFSSKNTFLTHFRQCTMGQSTQTYQRHDAAFFESDSPENWHYWCLSSLSCQAVDGSEIPNNIKQPPEMYHQPCK